MSVAAVCTSRLLKWQLAPQALNHFKTWSIVRQCSLVTVNPKPTENDLLRSVDDDLSHITPNFHQSYNIAAYVNRSETLQNLIKLNVNLSKIEKKPFVAEKILKLDFDRDMKDHIIFLNNFVDMQELGKYITKNPLIFYENLDDLQVRINYLVYKNFDEQQIKRIINKNPYWLMFSTLRIDRRLGYFQECFELSGNEVRYLSTRKPSLITYNLHQIKTNTFTVKEEMGFQAHEIKSMIMNKPKIWMLTQRALMERFNYIHNTMKIAHKVIVANPEVLLSRVHRIKQRHMFLEKLGRAQYDPKKPNYVPITALIKHTDIEFCNNFAKCVIDDYNLFLKTM